MTHFLTTAAFLASLGTLSILGFGYAPLPTAPAAQNPSKPADAQVHTGQVGEWWVTAPGRVQFRIVGSGSVSKDGKQGDLWFETPADKDSNTLFENLVLDVVMHAYQNGLAISVVAKNSSGDDGSEAAKAFDIERVGIPRN